MDQLRPLQESTKTIFVGSRKCLETVFIAPRSVFKERSSQETSTLTASLEHSIATRWSIWTFSSGLKSAVIIKNIRNLLGHSFNLKGGEGQSLHNCPPSSGEIIYSLAVHHKVHQTILLHSGRYRKCSILTFWCCRDQIYVKVRESQTFLASNRMLLASPRSCSLVPDVARL